MASEDKVPKYPQVTRVPFFLIFTYDKGTLKQNGQTGTAGEPGRDVYQNRAIERKLCLKTLDEYGNRNRFNSQSGSRLKLIVSLAGSHVNHRLKSKIRLERTSFLHCPPYVEL